MLTAEPVGHRVLRIANARLYLCTRSGQASHFSLPFLPLRHSLFGRDKVPRHPTQWPECRALYILCVDHPVDAMWTDA